MNKSGIILFAVILYGFGLVACTGHVVKIPEGVYLLEGGANSVSSEECDKIKSIIGETLILNKDSMLTSVLHDTEFLRYPVINLRDSTFVIYAKRPFSEETIPVEFIFGPWNSQLRFCENRMIYLKKK